MARADTHNHLGRNGNFSSFNEVIDHISYTLGENAIVGIANAGKSDNRYERFVNAEGYGRENLGNAIYIPDKKVLIIKAEEVINKKGHLLMLCMPEGKRIQSKTIPDALKEGKEEFNATIIADHPMYREGIGLYLLKNPKEKEKILSKLDGWEGKNSSAELFVPKVLPRKANKKAVEYWEEEINGKYEVGIMGATDGHQVRVIGRGYTILPFPDITDGNTLSESFKKSVRNQTNLENIVMIPNKGEALQHAWNMAVDTLRGKRKKSFQA